MPEKPPYETSATLAMHLLNDVMRLTADAVENRRHRIREARQWVNRAAAILRDVSSGEASPAARAKLAAADALLEELAEQFECPAGIRNR
jgi:lysyl-tRNA synthetase class I